MKQLFMLTLATCPFLLHTQTLANPGFEFPDTNRSGVAAWHSDGLYRMQRDTQVRHSGAASVRLTPFDSGDKSGTFRQELNLPQDGRLHKYRLSGFVKRNDVKGFTGIILAVRAGEDFQFISHPYYRPWKGTADWEKMEIDFFMDELTTAVNLGGMLSGQGQAWFDDFALQEIPLSDTPLPDSLTSYLEDALSLLQLHALYRDSVDWPRTHQRAFQLATGARRFADCYLAIQYAVLQLGDHHSFLRTAREAQKWAASDTVKVFRPCTGEMLDGQFAYLKMPGFGVGSAADKTGLAFADQLQGLIRQLDANQPKGWILDLRSNGGGSCWPMLAGIGPLLGEGLCGYFVAPKAKPRPWFYRKGKAGVGKRTLTEVSGKAYRLHQKMPPVAVLTGPGTASAGEIVAVAFRGRPNARSFGAPTTGLSTGNAAFPLRDGARLLLTVNADADRTGRWYGGKIWPDEWVEKGTKEGPDKVLEAAKAWLGKQ